MKSNLNSLVLIGCCFVFYVPTLMADIVVFTDRAEWANALAAVPTGHTHGLDFDAWPTGGLNTGGNFFPGDDGGMFTITIPGTPGFNAIDDSNRDDPFMDALSPNGSTYYLGDVGVTASEPPILTLVDYLPGFPVIGFGADWVVDGDLFMEVQGTTISFDEMLPGGSGFLGILSDQDQAMMHVNFSGKAAFGMDNLQTGNIVPEPASCGIAAIGLMLAVSRRIRRNS